MVNRDPYEMLAMPDDSILGSDTYDQALSDAFGQARREFDQTKAPALSSLLSNQDARIRRRGLLIFSELVSSNALLVVDAALLSASDKNALRLHYLISGLNSCASALTVNQIKRALDFVGNTDDLDEEGFSKELVRIDIIIFLSGIKLGDLVDAVLLLDEPRRTQFLAALSKWNVGADGAQQLFEKGLRSADIFSDVALATIFRFAKNGTIREPLTYTGEGGVGQDMIRHMRRSIGGRLHRLNKSAWQTRR